jgi:hypothetical protein
MKTVINALSLHSGGSRLMVGADAESAEVALVVIGPNGEHGLVRLSPDMAIGLAYDLVKSANVVLAKAGEPLVALGPSEGSN